MFSNISKGLQRLLEMVEPTQIPTDYGGTGNISLANAMLETGGMYHLNRQLTHLLYLKSKGTADSYKFDLKSGEKASLYVYTRSASSARVSLFRSDKIVLTNVNVRASFVNRDEDEDETGILTATGVSVFPKRVNSSRRTATSSRESSTMWVRTSNLELDVGSNGVNGHRKTNTETEEPSISSEGQVGNLCYPQCSLISDAICGPGSFVVEASDQDDMNPLHSGHSRGYFLVVVDVMC